MKSFNIIDCPLNGTNLIEASAGTGKTYIIASLFLRLILEKQFMIEDILSVTFTEAATEELRYRIRGRLREALLALTSNHNIALSDEFLNILITKYRNDESAIRRLRYALMNFDEASIYTIHGFCQRMLMENAFESGSLFDTELLSRQSELLLEIVDDYWRINFYNTPSLLAQYLILKKYSPDYFLQVLKNRSIDPSFEIIPDVTAPDINGIGEELLKDYERLCVNWSSMKLEVEGILLHAIALNRKTYRRSSIPAWIEAMDDFISLGDPMLRFDAFNRFTTSSIMRATKKDFQNPIHPFFDLCEHFETSYRSLESTFDRYILCKSRELFEYVKDELNKRKSLRNIRTFDDLLVDMHKSIREGYNSELARAVRSRFKAALVDEFQDTDPIQYDIFTTIFGTDDRILYLIGDPKQAIYRFRGADIFAYIKASSSIRYRYTLNTNWRSEPNLIRAVNTIFSRSKDFVPFIFEDIAFQEVKSSEKESSEFLYINGKHESQLHIWFIDRKYADKKYGFISKGKAIRLVSRSLAAEISRLLHLGRKGQAVIANKAIMPSDIAVLVRKNNQAKIVQDELRSLNIPSVLYGAESIFVSHEAMEMERVLSAIVEYGNERRIKVALTTDIFGFSGNEILAFTEDETGWEALMNRFSQYNDLWTRYGFVRMFRVLLKGENVRIKLLSYPDGERRITNLLHCSEVLHRGEVENKLSIDGLLKWFRLKLFQGDESEENQIRLETDEDAVKIITIHKSKGLEFPIVFCPFIWDRAKIDDNKSFTFHNPARDNRLTLDLNAMDEMNRRIAEKEELAENIRLLYVALTRAKNRCYLVWGKINQSESSALAYIFHKPNDLSPHNLVSELGDYVKPLINEDMFDDVKGIDEMGDGTIMLTGIPAQDSYQYQPYDLLHEKLSCREFKGYISKDWMITSYSSLVSNSRYGMENPDYDRVDSEVRFQHRVNEGETIFSFPRGVVAGACIHEIFENLDYTLTNSACTERLISQKLAKHGFHNRWQGVMSNMIKNVLTTPLKPECMDFILQKVDNSHRLNELEFYFPIERISPEMLSNIFSSWSGLNTRTESFASRMKRLGFRTVRGFLRGFIDMVFMFNDKYYIVDWKSNYLGDSIRDYNQDEILSAMEDHYYFFQYHLYVVALHRYLMTRMTEYRYDRHFGGVFYIFVRGVDPQRGPSYGIFHDFPSSELIDELNKSLISKS
ncbi:MAG: exodeoxyribonuclease V subunit beta [Spirochaetota bacterium]|nr:exodeoxyribonuclease V subunit beta [Spirochaetota bacterium]